MPGIESQNLSGEARKDENIALEPATLVWALLQLWGGGGADTAPGEHLQITLIVPPVIRKAAAFPIVAEVTNTHSSNGVVLQKAQWAWNGKEMREDLTEELAPTGNAGQKVRVLREKNKREGLTQDELAALAAQYEKWQKGVSYLRFLVTQEMAEEIKAKGEVKLSLKLQGRDAATQEEVQSHQEIVLTAARELARPPVPPGAHHSDWYFSDTHSHSTYTWDYSFGNGIYTIPELKSLAQVAGLDWLVLTDHAYCLDSTKYNEQKSTVTALSDSTFAFLYGEELSVAELANGSKAYDTAHYNGILNSTFVPCQTDIFRKASSPDSQQGIN